MECLAGGGRIRRLLACSMGPCLETKQAYVDKRFSIWQLTDGSFRVWTMRPDAIRIRQFIRVGSARSSSEPADYHLHIMAIAIGSTVISLCRSDLFIECIWSASIST